MHPLVKLLLVVAGVLVGWHILSLLPPWIFGYFILALFVAVISRR